MIGDEDVRRLAGALAGRGLQAHEDGKPERTIPLFDIEASPMRLGEFTEAFNTDDSVITVIAATATAVLRTYTGISDGAKVVVDHSAPVPSFTIKL
ncbi:MAG TPA: hypothetical protein VK502_01680 [Candidatus Saccharimonadales bacterium]|nr:hypothetical protein [Candidatus Saccharimonadales bacterium]